MDNIQPNISYFNFLPLEHSNLKKKNIRIIHVYFSLFLCKVSHIVFSPQVPCLEPSYLCNFLAYDPAPDVEESCIQPYKDILDNIGYNRKK